MSRTSKILEKFKTTSFESLFRPKKEQAGSAGFTDYEIPEESEATGFAGFGIPGQPETEDEEDVLPKGESLIDILARIYKTEPEDFIKPVFDREYEASCDILNEFFTYDFANRKKTQLHLNSESPDTTPITLTKTAVKASFADKTPEQSARQALELAYLAANNPVLMNGKKGVEITGHDPQTSYFLYLAAEKMGFGDKVLQAGYQPPEMPDETKEQFQAIIDKESDLMTAVAKSHLQPAEEPGHDAKEPESAPLRIGHDTQEPESVQPETEQEAEEPEDASPETDATAEPDSDPQEEQASQPESQTDEPHIAGEFNDIVNDPRYQMAVDYAAENGIISRSKLEKHVRENGQAIGSSTVSKIFNVMEDQGLVSEAGPQGRKYIGDTEDAPNAPSSTIPVLHASQQL